MRRVWRLVALVAVAAAAAWMLSRVAFRPRPIAVEVAEIARGPVEDVVANSEAGTVKTRAQARLGAERAGRVVDIPFREGSQVRRGDIVLRLDDSSARTQLVAARRDSQALDALQGAARSAERLARQNFDRTTELRDKAMVSQADMDEARSKLEAAEAERQAAEARVQSAESAVRLARDELDHLVVRAPFDGVVTRRWVEVGESIMIGQAVLEVMDTLRVYASAPIDERDAARLRAGLPARVTLDTYPDAVWNATVTRVAPMVEESREQDRTIEVEANLRIAPGGPVPRPGMTADVEVILSRRDSVLRVPTAAVIEGRRVLVAVRGRAVAKPFDAGLRNWQWTEVRSGLEPGDLVVTSLDRAGVKAGAPVSYTPPRSSGETQTSAAIPARP